MISFHHFCPWGSSPSISEDLIEKFKETINDPAYGFYQSDFQSFLDDSLILKNKIKRKIKHFVHVGLGGSSLGPEMLIKALNTTDTHFYFLNNIDSKQINDVLKKIELKETLFYIVSKSGTTAETMAIFSILTNFAFKHGVSLETLKDYFVFCTDPNKGDLRSFAQEHDLFCLDVPANIGGRFSVFSPVGFFPALWAGLNCEQFIQGIKDFKKDLEAHSFHNSWMKISGLILDWNQKYHINQTVLMPYSYQLKELSLWFVQLWAESLGKENKGLTPLFAYGATDQHSQVQLFMEGPKDKAIFFVECENHQQDFSLSSKLELKSLKRMDNISLNTLLTAELRGTELALQKNKRPYLTFKLPKIDEYHLAQLCFYLECLTVLVGKGLNIDPFNQPGVEAGKLFAWQWINEI